MSQSNITHLRPADYLATDVLTFSSDDNPDLYYPFEDPLVIMLMIDNYAVKWMLIDTESSSGILFALTFDQLKISKDRL